MKVVVMQPAFIPPASYFRLFAAADTFVILDSVQFNRSWYTHRQQLTNKNGIKAWLTLPLKKTDRDSTMINNLEWSVDWRPELTSRCSRFSIFRGDDSESMIATYAGRLKTPTPLDYVCSMLNIIRTYLGDKIEKTNIMYSSSFNIPSNIHGQNRILSICKKVGASEYINSTGGQSLYNPEIFDKENIKLTFLPEYKGSMDSVLERLDKETPEVIRQEIYDNL